jgi:hypothetical protein
VIARSAEVTVWTASGGDKFAIDLIATTASVSAYTRIGYIGHPMILEGKYDPDQMWLPFMQGAIMRHPPDDYYYGGPGEHRPGMVRRLAARAVRVEPRFEKMYDYVDKDQLLLPFVEYRFVPNGEFSRAKWLWPISENGVCKLFHQKNAIIHGNEEAFVEWGIESFSGRFAMDGGRVVFECEVDWLLTKLRFYGEQKIE